MPQLRKDQSKSKNRSNRKRSHQETDSSLAPAIHRRVEAIPGDLTGAATDAYVALVAERDALAVHLKSLKMKKKRLQEQFSKRRANKLDGFYLCIAENTHRALSPGKYDMAAHIPHHLLVRASLRREMSVADVRTICEHSYHSRYNESSPQNLLRIFMLGSTRICLHFPDDDTIIRVVTELCSLKRVLNTEHIVAKHQFLDIDLPFLSEAALTAFSRVTAPLCFTHIALRIRRADPTINALGKLSIFHSLDLSKTYITDDDVKALRENPTLVKIYMNECMCLRDVSPLAEILTLEEVELSECSYLSIVGALGKLPALRSLNLRGTCITNDELKALCESRTLLTIVLTDCRHLTDVSSLASVMTLQDVQLCNGSFISGLENLGVLPVLRSLDLRNTFYETDILTSLSVSRTLVKLDLGECHCLRDVSPLAAMQTLQELSLSGCYLSCGIATLGELRNLLSLDLSKTHITDDDVKALRENPTLVKIYMNECMCLRDVSPLAEILTLEEVELSECSYLSIVGALGKLPALRSLNLRGTCITNDELKALCESRTLLTIVLTDCRHLTDVSSLASIMTLQDVQLCNGSFISGLENLGVLPVLRSLDLRNTFYETDILTSLSVSRTLVKLDLGECRCLRDVSPLAAMQTLQELSLSGCYLSCGIATLGELRNLLSLDLSKTNITSAELFGIRKLPSLEKLDLSRCHLLHDVSCLAHLKSLKEVRLQRKGDMGGLSELYKLPLLHSLVMSKSYAIFPDIRFISECSALVKLDLHESFRRDHDVSPLASIKTLEEINLSKNCITGAELLGKLPALRILDLSMTNITDDTVVGISESRTLIKLILAECRSLKNVSPLSSIKTLKEIDLGSCIHITEVGKLGDLPALHSLNLEFSKINIDGLREISKSRTLVNLNMNYCTYSRPLNDVSPLANMKTLEEVRLQGYDATSGLDALCELPALRILDIGHSNDNDVPQVIQRCRSLVQLSLSEFWNIKHVSVLASINSLTEIDLSGCRKLNDLDTLGQLPSLRFLKLRKCELYTFSLRGISNSPSLVMLDLSNCERLTGIAPLLQIHTLEELYLTGCTSLDSYCTGVLGKSHALRILNLSGTRINNNTLLGLSESRTLIKLDVSYCYSLTDASPLASIKTLGELVLLGCYDHLLPSALRALAIRLKYEEDYCSDEDF